MVCLTCHSEMEQKILKGVLVDYCKVCHAFWVDKEEINKLHQGSKKSIKELQQEAKKEKGDLIHFFGTCPRCEGKIVVNHFEDCVPVDLCNSCGGMFLDRGELDRILKIKNNTWDHKIIEFFMRLFKKKEKE